MASGPVVIIEPSLVGRERLLRGTRISGFPADGIVVGASIEDVSGSLAGVTPAVMIVAAAVYPTVRSRPEWQPVSCIVTTANRSTPQVTQLAAQAKTTPLPKPWQLEQLAALLQPYRT